MTAHVGFVDNSGGVLAHYKMLEKIKDVCLAEGWVVLRYNTTIDNRELIVKAPGLTGLEEIYCGIYCYQDSNNDYYNLAVATMKGFVTANPFSAQPGISPVSGVPCHNIRVDYWISINAQRINCAMKVGTPVYESFALGKFFPYSRPSQYPEPLIAAGMLNGTPATRFSDMTHSFPWKGKRANLVINNSGAWLQPDTTPWCNIYRPGNIYAASVRPSGDKYAIKPVELFTQTVLNNSFRGDCYGVIDGIFYITGFNNAVENTLIIDGKTYVVIQDVSRTNFGDYIAMELS